MPGLLVLIALLGLASGSFLTVVIDRVPRGESVVRPGSRCPNCGTAIRARHNIPVLGWLLLRGRCASCGAPIGARYPLIELTTCVLFVLLTLRTGADAALPAYLYLGAVGIALAAIDLGTRRLPNAIVLPSYPVLAVLLALASWGEEDWPALLRAVIGGVSLWLAYFALILAYPAGMGFGDVKLAGLLGGALAWLGWGAFAIGSFSAFVLGGIYSIGLVAAGRAGRKTGIPFGPWMILGAAVGIAVGEPLWDAYLGLLR